jgi:DNA-binding NarL/FixJ family response regulator
MSEIKILVVDDQRLIREGIASLLDLQKDLNVVGTAGNGKIAVRMAEEFKPDIILMDIRMPVMDGIVAVREVVKKKLDCQVIMLTTFDDDEYILRSLQEGAVGYLLKDIQPDDLAGAIRMASQGIYQLSSSVTGRLVGRINKGRICDENKILKEIPEKLGNLSDREKEVLKNIALGLTNREIAESLFISEGTVKNHVSRILSELQLRDRTQAALYVIKNRITL